MSMLICGWKTKYTVYRLGLENVTVSGRTIEQAVAAEYAAGVGRFV
jgi:hypothetical protein